MSGSDRYFTADPQTCRHETQGILHAGWRPESVVCKDCGAMWSVSKDIVDYMRPNEKGPAGVRGWDAYARGGPLHSDKLGD